MIGALDVMRGVHVSNPQYRLKTLKETVEVKMNELESLLAKVDLLHSELEKSE